MLLKITGENYNITIYDARGYFEKALPSGRVVAYHASTPQVQVLFPGWAKADSTVPPYCSGSINEYQSLLGDLTLEVSLQTDPLIGTSAHAPQRPTITYTGMGTVGPASWAVAPQSLIYCYEMKQCSYIDIFTHARLQK
ncbi:hypothetical protein TNCV_3426371 [Trichonephila clavipes]|nr:hypothetical protein TNCV_3426371 [Trichonephila clavipes]